jgi:hypothetical protein
MGVYSRWKFTAISVCLLGSVVIHPLVLPGYWGGMVAFAVVSTLFFATATLAMCEEKWQRAQVVLLGILCIAGRWTELFFAGRKAFTVEIGERVVQVVFLTFTVAMLVRAIFRKRTVTLDSLLGAFAGYLLLAVLWGIIFSLVELVFPGSFHVGESFGTTWNSPAYQDSHLIYFSCCNMLTVSYGDIIPARSVARTLSFLETMTGQLYLAVLVAMLVGIKVAQAGTLQGGSGPGVGPGAGGKERSRTMAKKEATPVSSFEGRWHIVPMTEWDEDLINAEVRGFIEFGAKGSGEFQFGHVHGWMDCRPATRDGEPAAEWTWDGNDERGPAQGRGWAVLKGGELHGRPLEGPLDRRGLPGRLAEPNQGRRDPARRPSGHLQRRDGQGRGLPAGAGHGLAGDGGMMTPCERAEDSRPAPEGRESGADGSCQARVESVVPSFRQR